MQKLPTKEEYIKQQPKNYIQNLSYQWSCPKYKCEVCGGNMRKNLAIVPTSNPAQYKYVCDQCYHVDYLFI